MLARSLRPILRVQKLQVVQIRTMSSTNPALSSKPMEEAIRSKVGFYHPNATSYLYLPKELHHFLNANKTQLTAALSPTTLQISNDSASHAHHRAMANNTSPETHFHVTVISDAFTAKPQPARHRMVYKLLSEELAREGGVHALQLVTRTVEEDGRRAAAAGG